MAAAAERVTSQVINDLTKLVFAMNHSRRRSEKTSGQSVLITKPMIVAEAATSESEPATHAQKESSLFCSR